MTYPIASYLSIRPNLNSCSYLPNWSICLNTRVELSNCLTWWRQWLGWISIRDSRRSYGSRSKMEISAVIHMIFQFVYTTLGGCISKVRSKQILMSSRSCWVWWGSWRPRIWGVNTWITWWKDLVQESRSCMKIKTALSGWETQFPNLLTQLTQTCIECSLEMSSIYSRVFRKSLKPRIISDVRFWLVINLEIYIELQTNTSLRTFPRAKKILTGQSLQLWSTSSALHRLRATPCSTRTVWSRGLCRSS